MKRKTESATYASGAGASYTNDGGYGVIAARKSVELTEREHNPLVTPYIACLV